MRMSTHPACGVPLANDELMVFDGAATCANQVDLLLPVAGETPQGATR